MSYYRVFSVGVLFLLSVVSVPRVWAQATLENPQPDSFQSGIGVISGWACEATQIEIAFDGGAPTTAAYGTSRGDTQSVCGDTDNGFGLTYNWNLLGDGEHTVRALADGVEFATVTVTVTTLGAAFLKDKYERVLVQDFPESGTAVVLTWQEAQQNFVIQQTYARPAPELYCLVEFSRGNVVCVSDSERHGLNDTEDGQGCEWASAAPHRRHHFEYTCDGWVKFNNACESFIAEGSSDPPLTSRLIEPDTYISYEECLPNEIPLNYDTLKR